MDKALFLSQADVYNGHYCITKRDASHEFTKELHYHDFYEVQFYLCETANGIIGDIMINGQKRTLMQGCLVLINMFDPHQIHITCKEPYTRYCISFWPVQRIRIYLTSFQDVQTSNIPDHSPLNKLKLS